MSGKAGQDIGKELGSMMDRKFESKAAKRVSKIGQILGMILICIGALILRLCYGLDGESGMLTLIGILVAVVGIALMVLLHFLSLRIEKKHIGRE